MKWSIDSVSQLYATCRTIMKNDKLCRLLGRILKGGKDAKVTFRVSFFSRQIEEEFEKNVTAANGEIKKVDGKEASVYEITIPHSKWREIFGKMDMYDFMFKEHKVLIVAPDGKEYRSSVNPLPYIFCKEAFQ